MRNTLGHPVKCGIEVRKGPLCSAREPPLTQLQLVTRFMILRDAISAIDAYITASSR